ncbi:MAG: hypothetical protein LBQ35_06455 [Spirochaetaceae bacterium]|jgi:hypothetical protein|nr:hypothetical protein [Spirochaetaceae bacterium]
MLKRFRMVVPLVLCGVLLLSACGEEEAADTSISRSEAAFPVVDALSSASILRVDSHTVAYVGERVGTNYKLNLVDLDNPGEKLSREIGGNVAVITAGGGRIALIQAVEHGYETFAGQYTRVYDAGNLALVKTIPLAPPEAEGRVVEPLHHRDPSLAISDRYVAVATEDDGFFSSGGAQQYLNIYEIGGSGSSPTLPIYGGASGGARGSSAIGALMGVAINGDYLLVGGSTGTAVYKIDSGLELTQVAASDGVGNHWFKDNGVYVLESKSNTGTVKVWKWNGGEAPTALGTIDVNETGSGSVQALAFDADDPAKAYFYAKVTGGNVYSVNLAAASLTKTLEFSFPNAVITISGRGGSASYEVPLITGLWTIEKQSTGGHDYYVFSGSYSYTPAGGAAVTNGAVFIITDPPRGANIANQGDATTPVADSRVTVEGFTAPWGTAVRTLKTFKSSSGDIYFAAKNYTASGAASNYKLVLKQIN